MGGGSGVAVSGFRQVFVGLDASYVALMFNVCCICSTITACSGDVDSYE